MFCYVLLCFPMFLLSFAMFCYVLLCFAMFCYVEKPRIEAQPLFRAKFRDCGFFFDSRVIIIRGPEAMPAAW